MSYGALERMGIELEYMLVRKDSLQVAPVADLIFAQVNGEESDEVVGEGVDWSNELVRHVIELKNPRPAPEVRDVAQSFYAEVKRLQTVCDQQDLLLLPSAMHPWMDPVKETRLWPLEGREIYQSYDRIFQCQGHGWSNLQSTHINLCFGRTDQEFGNVHAVLRTLTPLVPLIACSSPFQEGQTGPMLSTRIFHYLKNQRRIPSIIGPVIPEPVWSETEYRSKILDPIFKDIAEFDPNYILRHDWLNSRAVIPKFATQRFEIRVMDLQECPKADLSIAWFFIALARSLLEQGSAKIERLKELSSEQLFKIFVSAAQEGEEALISDKTFLHALDLPQVTIKGQDLLHHLFDTMQVDPRDRELGDICKKIITRGTLSRQLLIAAGKSPSHASLFAVYNKLSDCLRQNQLFYST